MDFIKTCIPELIIIKPKIFIDSRGEFLETFRAAEFSAAGINADFVQDNHAGSKQGVLRGLHYQIQNSQGKLIRVISGEIYDVAVDLRKSSPTFGKYAGVSLDDQEKRLLWIPPGFAHGYYVMSSWAEVSYKVTDYHSPTFERTIIWNDPGLNITWPILSADHPLLSENDQQGLNFQEAEHFE